MFPHYSRREFLKNFLKMAGCFAASAQLPFLFAKPALSMEPKGSFHFPQGVGSGDPTENSVFLWTRVESLTKNEEQIEVFVEISETEEFSTLVLQESMVVSEKSDFTLRLFVDNLKPSKFYYYRFRAGNDVSDLTGRTRTAPSKDSNETVNFALASCQNLQLGHMTPYRRMIWDDQKKPVEDQIQFVLHLGDFIYEEVWDIKILKVFLKRDVRQIFPNMPNAKGIYGDGFYPVSVNDYRAIYKAYLSEPDLRAARARWPFICTWDDHEFSNDSWQSQEMYDGDGKPAQNRKVAANQAWFEYIPSFLSNNPGVGGVEQFSKDFTPVNVKDTPIEEFDEDFTSLDPNNLKAINSLVIFRSLRWGKNIELIITDDRSYKSPNPLGATLESELKSPNVLWFLPEDLVHMMDAGKTYNNGRPLNQFSFNGKTYTNPRANSPKGTLLGKTQKNWWKETIKASDATWKLWGNSVGLLSRRVDLQNLPGKTWKGSSYGLQFIDDWDGYPSERAEVINFLKENKIKNVVSLCGDRHIFSAGYVSPSYKEGEFSPVAIEMGTSSINTPGVYEVYEYIKENNPDIMQPNEIYVVNETDGNDPKSDLPAINLTFQFGVQASLAFAKNKSVQDAKALKNDNYNPHLKFIDNSHHGYSLVRVTKNAVECFHVGMDRPIKALGNDEGPEVKYIIGFETKSWTKADQPVIKVRKTSGTLPFPYNKGWQF